jgi:hypothetical protein
MTEIEKAAEALIAAIKAEIQRIPRGTAHHDAEDQFYAACREIEHRIGHAVYEVIGRRSVEERQYAHRAERARKNVRQNEKRRAERAAIREAKLATGQRWNQQWAARRKAEAERPAKELAALKTAMAAAHPDRGGTNEAFIAARKRYVAAKARIERS